MKVLCGCTLAAVVFIGTMVTLIGVPRSCHVKVQAVVVGSQARLDYGRCDVTVEYDAYGETYTNTLIRLCANDTGFAIVRGCVAGWRPGKLRPYDTDDPMFMPYSAAVAVLAVATVIAGAIAAFVVWMFLPEKWRFPATVQPNMIALEVPSRNAVYTEP